MNNGIIFKSKRQLYIRLPVGILMLLLFALFPILASAIGAELSEWITGEACYEANCFWGGLFWYSFFTIPIAMILFIIYLIIGCLDFYTLKKTP